MFNLKDDPGEKKDLSQSNPEKLKELDAKLMKHLKSTTDRIPVQNPNFKGGGKKKKK